MHNKMIEVPGEPPGVALALPTIKYLRTCNKHLSHKSVLRTNCEKSVVTDWLRYRLR